MRKLLIALIAATILVAPGRISAQAASPSDSALDAQTTAIASQLRCPVCQGLSIQDSPADLAKQMRAIARQQLAEGRSPEDVRRYFIARYGEWILMAPPTHGFSGLVYLVPLLLLAIGVAVLVVALRRWTAPAVGSVPEDVGENL